jgi:transcriptional regulator with XRE-family HTH domain
MNRTAAGVAASGETASAKSSRSWDEVRAELDLDDDTVARRRTRLGAEVRVHKLAEVRRRRQVTQLNLAQMLGTSQSHVSRIERQSLDDTVLSTLVAYVGALGGRVRVVADFGDDLVVLSGITANAFDADPDDAALRKRRSLAQELKAEYEAGASIRALSDETGLSCWSVRRLLSESGVILRARGGAIRKPSSRPVPER